MLTVGGKRGPVQERAEELAKLESNLLLGYIASLLERQLEVTGELLREIDVLRTLMQGVEPGIGVMIRGTVQVKNPREDYQLVPLEVHVANRS